MPIQSTDGPKGRKGSSLAREGQVFAATISSEAREGRHSHGVTIATGQRHPAPLTATRHIGIAHRTRYNLTPLTTPRPAGPCGPGQLTGT